MGKKPQPKIEFDTAKSRPIIFGGFSVRHIIDGRKTQTRRPMNPQPPDWIDEFGYSFFTPKDGLHISGRGSHPEHGPADAHFCCPYGKKDDRLWVKETWQMKIHDYWYHEIPDGFVWNQKEAEFFFRADGIMRPDGQPWRSPLFMPRWASRLTLKITGFRVERLQDISREDAIAEGILEGKYPSLVRDQFRILWDEINRKRKEFWWDKNPWVWVIEFRRLSDES